MKKIPYTGYSPVVRTKDLGYLKKNIEIGITSIPGRAAESIFVNIFAGIIFLYVLKNINLKMKKIPYTGSSPIVQTKDLDSVKKKQINRNNFYSLQNRPRKYPIIF